MPPKYWILILTALLAAAIAHAAVIRLPQDVDNMMDAVDNSGNGDTVYIAAGRYEGAGNVNVVIPHRLLVQSLAGPAETIFDGENADSVSILNILNAPSTIVGLTFTGASIGAVTFNNSAGFIIRNCRFVENVRDTANGQGAGLLLINQSRGDIVECLFDGNETVQSGAGLYATQTSVFNVLSCVFMNNRSTRFGGGSHCVQDALGTFISCLFIDNSAGIDGGGASVSVRSNSIYRNCTFFGNRAEGMGGGLYKGSNSTPRVTDCIFWDNEAGQGNQIFGQDNGGEIQISFCDVQGGVEDQGLINAGEGLIDEDPRFAEGRAPVFGSNAFFLDPESPCVDAGSAAAEELGMDSMLTRVDLEFDADAVDIGFHYDPDLFQIIARLFGFVTDAANDRPIEDATVFTSYGFAAQTDEDGFWEIDNALAEIRFRVFARKEWYNDRTSDELRIEENGELQVDFALLHPEFALSDDELSAAVNRSDSTALTLTLSNNGNGPLAWRAQTQLLPENDIPPWELRLALDSAGVTAGDTRLQGVIFDGEHFLVAGGADAQQNLIYVFNSQGEIIDRFRQPGESNYGMRDLDWDGELIWGCDLRMLYGFQPGGEVAYSIQTPFNPAVSVAWDAERGRLWCSALTSNIIAFDLEGNQVAQIPRNGLRLYGLACWADDPDGYDLYVMHQDGANTQVVYKMNTENGDTMFAANLSNLVQGTAGGIHITEEFDNYAVSLVTVPNRGAADHIDVWQLAAKRNWARLEPLAGVVEANEEMDLILTFHAANLHDGVYEGEIVFDHSAFPGQTIVPYALEVTEGPVFAQRRINLRMGWNLVSANLQPENPEIQVVLGQLVDAGALICIKNQDGRFWLPGRGFEPMFDWNVSEGYLIKAAQPANFNIQGITVPANEPIALRQGWQLVSYYPRRAMDAIRAVEGLGEDLIIIKDGDGNFYSPVYRFSTLGNCREGQGYAMKMARPAELIWGGGRMQNAECRMQNYNSKFQIPNSKFNVFRIESKPTYLQSPPSTGFDMSLLLLTDEPLNGEIGVYAGERLVGAGVMQQGRCGIAVRGDDPTTAEIEGACEGEELQIEQSKIQNPKSKITYETNDFKVMHLEAYPIPDELALLSAYPNPFNSMTTINYALPLDCDVSLRVFDISGREVIYMNKGVVRAGWRTLQWDARGIESGLYFARLDLGNERRIIKLIVIK